jgi:hypothetical protein
MSWSEAEKGREDADCGGTALGLPEPAVAGEGVMRWSSMGRSRVRAVCGGGPRMGAVMGDEVRGVVLLPSWGAPIAARERRLERGCTSLSSPRNSPRSAAMDWGCEQCSVCGRVVVAEGQGGGTGGGGGGGGGGFGE